MLAVTHQAQIDAAFQYYDASVTVFLIDRRECST